MIIKDKMDFAIKEFDSAWQEFFEDKPEPKNDEQIEQANNIIDNLEVQ
jgi:hypothetical protein